MTWKISTRRSLPPSMRCRVPKSSRATLFSALQALPISAGPAAQHTCHHSQTGKASV